METVVQITERMQKQMGKIQFSLIACVDENWGIGKDGKLLKSIPEDMEFFKKLTMNNTVIMGRKTLESLPGKRGLAGRANIVLTRDKNYVAEDASVVHSIDELIKHIERNKLYTGRIFVIGGGEIYRLLLPYCKKAYITRLHEQFDADTFFPDLGCSCNREWELVKTAMKHAADGTDYEFLEYENTDAILTEDLMKGARLVGVLGEAAERIEQLKQENLEYRLKIESLAKGIMENSYCCPLKDNTDIDFEKECTGFKKPGCMECIIRHSDDIAP